MALSNIEQIKKLLDESKNILITFKSNFDGDALGSALALKLFIEQLGKRADIVCDDFVLHPRFAFLKRSNKVGAKLGDLHQCLINVDIEESGLSELSYDIKDGEKLRIFLTPKTGYITKEQITTSQTEYKYDLIITLDTPDLTALHGVYTHHEDFFYATPLINIDHKSSNEHYGTVNHIDMPASTTSEIVYQLITRLGEEHITRHMANALLTGLIDGTKSFKHRKVRPQTLDVASKLVDIGADRSFIIKNLYQTKSISTFRLWGTALANLTHDNDHNIVSTTITRDDFVRSGATQDDLNMIIDELITTSPDAQIILVLNEHPDETGHIQGSLRIIPAHHATDIMKKYQAQGDEDHATFSIKGKNLKDVEHELLTHIKEELS